MKETDHLEKSWYRWEDEIKTDFQENGNGLDSSGSGQGLLVGSSEQVMKIWFP
jgi:hypothetical protein